MRLLDIIVFSICAAVLATWLYYVLGKRPKLAVFVWPPIFALEVYALWTEHDLVVRLVIMTAMFVIAFRFGEALEKLRREKPIDPE